MNKAVLQRPDIVSALRLATAVPAEPARWECSALAGQLVELSGLGASATLTLAFSLVLDAQRRGEPVAWLTDAESTFFPPDAAEGGVDLGALAVVRVTEPRQLLRAADHLARSGAFGLLVLDLSGDIPLPLAAQTRLGGLATKHETLILCLTRKGERESSLGSLISLRGEAVREHAGEDRFACRVRVLKDKRRGPGWGYVEACRGPDGLR